VIRVVLADDHYVVRQGLRALLEAEADIAVVGEAPDGRTALGLIEALRPDVVLLDLSMSGMGGLEVCRRAMDRFPCVRIIIFSIHEADAYVLEALRGGAMAYVLKSAPPAEILIAIREAIAGRRYLGSVLSDRVSEAVAQPGNSPPGDPLEGLTQREREVFGLVAEGRTNAEIAAMLGIGIRTVETHRANLMRKLGLSRHAELIRFAIRHGLSPCEPADGSLDTCKLRDR
jgi:DNA-binding NarL/FixJ family response regulator